MKNKKYGFLKDFSFGSFIAGVACVALVAVVVCLLYFSMPLYHDAKRPDSMAAFKKVSEIERLIRAVHIDIADEKHQTDTMMQGLVAGLDDTYAAYYTKEEYEEIKRTNAGMTKGIGITITQNLDTGELIIIHVSEGMPAEEAGLLENDILLAINGIDMTGMDSSTAAQEIQKSEGPVTLEIRRPGIEEPLTFTMEKTDMKVMSVSGIMLDGDIGYIQIGTFNGVTSEQFAEEYARLKEENMKGLVIDLRNNLGGLVTACCDTVSQILPAGPIVFEQDRTGEERHQDCAGESPIEIPLALLVNQYTASASEIFTGAVRDYSIGTIIGEPTYGKGIEQNTYTLSDGSALKLTTTIYYTPKHEDINGTGIVPDILVELPIDAESDLQLDKALEVLQEEIASKN